MTVNYYSKSLRLKCLNLNSSSSQLVPKKPIGQLHSSTSFANLKDKVLKFVGC